MRYIFTLFALSAYGFLAANNDLIASDSVDTSDYVGGKKAKNSTKENLRESAIAEGHTFSRPDTSVVTTPTPIRTLILPNNVCVINRDLAPDRSIEEHILACVKAQRIRNAIAR